MDHQNMNMLFANDLVLRNVLSHLPLSDLKSCRLVSSKWNALSENQFIKLCVCCIHNDNLEQLKEFNKIFPILPAIYLRNFRLKGHFFAHELEAFFNDWKFIIKELILEKITIYDNKRIELKRYNVSTWSGLNILKLDIKSDVTKFIVPFSYIGTIKSLFLDNTCIVYDGRIAPTKIRAHFVTGVRNGRRLNKNDILDLNEYIDVSNLKELDFAFGIKSYFRLDLTHCLRLEYFALSKAAEVIGWHNNLILNRIYIFEMTLDLSDLPPSVVQLNTSCVTDLRNSANGRLLNLKSLCFGGAFPWFAQCPNLIHVRTTNETFDLDTLPICVRSMAIRSTCEFVGERVVQLDKLVFFDFKCNADDWECVNKALDRVNPKIVVIGIVCGARYELCQGDLDNLLKTAHKQMKKGGTFVLKRQGCKRTRIAAIPNKGGGDNPPPSLEDGHLYHDYHVYENGYGRRICESEFDQQWVGLPTESSLKVWYIAY